MFNLLLFKWLLLSVSCVTGTKIVIYSILKYKMFHVGGWLPILNVSCGWVGGTWQSSDKFNINSQLENMQTKYVGTGHAYMNRL